MAEDFGDPPSAIDFPEAVLDAPLAEDACRGRADLVLVGRADGTVRLRTFHVRAGVSVAIHGWLRSPWPSQPALHRGAAVGQRLRLQGPLVVPRVLEEGRGFRHAWLVEELMEGRHPAVDEWPAVVPIVLEGLVGLWTAGRPERRQLQDVLANDVRRDALTLVEAASPQEIGGGRVTAGSLSEWLRRRPSVLVGWTHGDPARLNTLLLPDGRLALTDWEVARRRPIGYDVAKALMGVAELGPALTSLAARTRLLPQGADGWRDQVIAGCVIRLGRTAIRAKRADRAGDAEFREAVAFSRNETIDLLGRLL